MSNTHLWRPLTTDTYFQHAKLLRWEFLTFSFCSSVQYCKDRRARGVLKMQMFAGSRINDREPGLEQGSPKFCGFVVAVGGTQMLEVRIELQPAIRS